MKPAENKPAAPTLSVAVDGALYASAVDRFGGRLFVGGSSGTAYGLDLNAPVARLSPRDHAASYIGAMAIVGDATSQRQLIIGRYDGSLTWYDLHGGLKLRTVAAHAGWICDLDVVSRDVYAGDRLPAGDTLVSVGHDMLVKTWDARTGTLRQTLAGHAAETREGYASALYAVAASPREPIVASGDRTGEVRIWDLRGERETARITCSAFYTFDGEKRDRSIGGVRRLRFSPDGSRLAVAGIGPVTNVDGFVGPCRIEVWDWRAGRRTAVLQDSHQAVLNDLRWTADGRHLVAGGGGDGGGLLIAWAVDPNLTEAQSAELKPVQKIKLKGHLHRLHFLSGDRSLVVVGFEGVQTWDSVSLFPAERKGSDERKA